MKQILSIILTLPLLFSLTACAPTGEASLLAETEGASLPEETTQPVLVEVDPAKMTAAADQTTGEPAPAAAPAAETEAAAPAVDFSGDPLSAGEKVMTYYLDMMAWDHLEYVQHQYSGVPYAGDVFSYHHHHMTEQQRRDYYGDQFEKYNSQVDYRLLYAMEDIDGDGTQEILIGYSENSAPAVVLRAFYYNGTAMVPMWDYHGYLMQDLTVVQIDEAWQSALGETVFKNGALQSLRPTTFHIYDMQEDAKAHGGSYQPQQWLDLSERL